MSKLMSYFRAPEIKHHSINNCGKIPVNAVKAGKDITESLPKSFYIIGNDVSGEDKDTCFEFDKSKHSIYVKESHKTSKSASKKGGRKGTRKHKKTRKHK